MILIVEGYDYTGKTTMCKALQEALGGVIIDFSKEFEKPIRSYQNWEIISETYFAVEYLFIKYCNFNENVILHRFYPTREVYNKFYPRPFLIKINPKELPFHHIVYLTANLNVLEERAEKNGEVFDRKKAKAIMEEFDKYFDTIQNNGNVKIWRADTSHANLESYKNYATYFREVVKNAEG